MRSLIVVATWTIIAGFATFAAQHYVARARVQRRLWASESAADGADEPVEALDRGWLVRWLYVAGFRHPQALAYFLSATAAAIGSGLLVAFLVSKSSLLTKAVMSAGEMPGGIGSAAQPILRESPWLLLFILGALPMSVVRGTRRRRIAQVERDLPITLELLATLAESGIGFDAATRRILDSQPSDRALATELRTLQSDLLAGRSRVDCLRRVARRLDVISVTIFISAIVQAEQIGSGVAAVLRQQADDLRQRRRERALEFSMALPVKQLFPLVICFLPGILIFAIAPLFAEFLKYSASFGGLR